MALSIFFQLSCLLKPFGLRAFFPAEQTAQNSLVQSNNFVCQGGSGFRYGTNQRGIKANIHELFQVPATHFPSFACEFKGPFLVSGSAMQSVPAPQSHLTGRYVAGHFCN